MLANHSHVKIIVLNHNNNKFTLLLVFSFVCFVCGVLLLVGLGAL